MFANDAREKYLNPYTDFGFKRLFGEEVTIGILNFVFDEI